MTTNLSLFDLALIALTDLSYRCEEAAEVHEGNPDAQAAFKEVESWIEEARGKLIDAQRSQERPGSKN